VQLIHTVPQPDEPPPWIVTPKSCSMKNLEQLAALLGDAISNLDPQEFDAIAAAAKRFKTEDQESYSALMHGGCAEFAILFRAVERAVTGE
jgi:hypothetical protein